jgi:hypothetical protein
MSQDQKPFSVNDRRHFRADGEPRGEASEEGIEVPPVPGSREEPPNDAAGPAPPPAPVAADFSAFVLSLAAPAGLLLSEEVPEAERATRLSEVRHVISILEMLKDKTEGRRTSREDQMLEGVLYELRMGYLARARVGGA